MLIGTFWCFSPPELGQEALLASTGARAAWTRPSLPGVATAGQRGARSSARARSGAACARGPAAPCSQSAQQAPSRAVITRGNTPVADMEGCGQSETPAVSAAAAKGEQGGPGQSAAHKSGRGAGRMHNHTLGCAWLRGLPALKSIWTSLAFDVTSNRLAGLCQSDAWPSRRISKATMCADTAAKRRAAPGRRARR
ncbi:MAG: hypothetical protein J3K34DRAFT_406848 [Monoraphidium minutum]|nr:MAG: hypothetical protein J3K34DRAFT_406848 [Monoraphidium minutum]